MNRVRLAGFFFSMFFLMFCISNCKTLESSSALSAFGDQIMLDGQSVTPLYLKHVIRGNDDTIGATPESQHETALLEFAIYDKSGELWMDYTFFSPAIPEVRRQVEVGITSRFGIRQVANQNFLAEIPSIQGDILFYENLLSSEILQGTSRSFVTWENRRRTRKIRNGFASMQQLGLVDSFKVTDRGPVFLKFVHEKWSHLNTPEQYSNLVSITPPEEFTAADGARAFRFQLQGAASLRTSEYYHKSYTARIKLAGRGYQSKQLGGSFVAQAGSVFNANATLFGEKVKGIYKAIDLNQVKNGISDQIVRQLVNWSYQVKKTESNVGMSSMVEIKVDPFMLSMAAQGRAAPNQDLTGNGNTAGVFSTDASEKAKMAKSFYPPANQTQRQRLNETSAWYEDMLRRDEERYRSQVQ